MFLWSPVLGVVTSPYNLARIHPISKRKIPHLGTDFVAPSGREVRALANGTVVATAKHAPGDTSTNGVLPGRSGSCLLVDHGNGVRTYYGHTAPHVGPGEKVKGGQVIGRSDGSGNITGPHLHLEVHVSGVAVNPEPWAEQRGLDIGITDTTAPQEADDMTKEEHDALVSAEAYIAWVAKAMGHGGSATEFWRIRQQLGSLSGQVAGLSTALAQIGAGKGVDLAAVQEAARKGAADAIDSIEVKVVGA